MVIVFIWRAVADGAWNYFVNQRHIETLSRI